MNDNIRQQIMDAKQCMGCLHEGLIVTAPDGTIVETSPAAERILEAPSLSLKGRQVRDFCSMHDVYDDLIRQTNVAGRSLNKSLMVLANENKRKIVNMSVQRVGEGDDAQFVHVFQDCADLRTMEERLVQSERLATIGRFASQIAHEIRNPLSSITLNVELLEDEVGEAGDEARGLIRSVLKELDRLNDIVSEYLQFSRFPKPHLQRGYADNAIQELVANFKTPPNVKLETALMSSSPELWLDERLLRQVLENLVRNGVEAIEGQGAVRIETDVVDRFFVIRVKDTGRGVPPEIQARLFEPFFTTKAHGTGLGLATSQQIIFEHNGHLVVESQAGKGSTFSILLPL
ncbi:MAG TPA: ATP-binding protein [Terriglobia bacterium]|nr:ATP-binding protein [Terriglobia bacterium]